MIKFLTGITLIKNGDTLKYPYKECIRSLSSYCDQVLVNVGHGEDITSNEVFKLVKELDNIQMFNKWWDMKNTGNGEELAKQANNMLLHASGQWIIYMQADEMLTQKDGLKLKETLKNLPNNINQVELLRTYFWGSLKTRAQKHEIWLGRVFRQWTHIVGGDGMYIEQRVTGGVVRHPALIFHYSRMGNEEDVNARWRNIDLLFHDTDKVAKFNKFEYNTKYRTDILKYNGPHPDGIEEFYNA